MVMVVLKQARMTTFGNGFVGFLLVMVGVGVGVGVGMAVLMASMGVFISRSIGLWNSNILLSCTNLGRCEAGSNHIRALVP